MSDFYHQYIADIVLEALEKMPDCNIAQLLLKLDHLPRDIVRDYAGHLVNKGLVVKTTTESGGNSITTYNVKEQ